MGNGGQAYQIQDPSAELRALLLAFGISTPPGQFWLSPLVSPVSIVDSRVTFTAETIPLLPDLRSSAGELTNPAANTRLANTGQLAAGNYFIKLNVTQPPAGAAMFRLRRRNAADAADINSMVIRAAVHDVVQFEFVEMNVALNERFVIENDSAPGAGLIVQGTIWSTRLA